MTKDEGITFDSDEDCTGNEMPLAIFSSLCTRFTDEEIRSFMTPDGYRGPRVRVTHLNGNARDLSPANLRIAGRLTVCSGWYRAPATM